MSGYEKLIWDRISKITIIIEPLPPVVPPTNTFIERCDTFNGSIWAIEYGAPRVSGGEWGFITDSRAKSVSSTQFGYGHYKIKFRVTGTRSPGVNYFVFWYSAGPPYNEIDIEMWGQDPSDEIRISNYRNSTEKTTPDQFIRTGRNFEDGLEHTMDIFYSTTLFEVWIDGYRVVAQANPAAMPMIFYPGGITNPNSDRGFYLTNIEYTPAS